ncbi:beta-fructofuranosidase [Lachnospiraceae bacterium XBB1006]|nr:beta-fructofuranosidase [Lachnospiraceae bacterium XBB1006]
MDKEKRYYPLFHLGPMSGWLNDPNGLCQLSGVHHIFFQYSPDEPRGGRKCWGHYETRDFVSYRFTGTFLEPDAVEDRDGVYSGCAYVKDGRMYLFYTGNVKWAGAYDYVYAGREANTMLVTSCDGVLASPKECLMRNEDYPGNLSCHVRDPKVFLHQGRYYMVQGARTRDDEGCVLLFSSMDLRHWGFEKAIFKPKFGYMWECPDLFWLSGKAFLSVSPQGLAAEEFCYQNVYQSGYFSMGKWSVLDEASLEEFHEWDYGFDFYAPQTYEDEQGRRILIGWMGMPDAPYDHDPTIAEGWQHMLTIPRQLQVDDVTGRIRQTPLPEMLQLREEELFCCEMENEPLLRKMEDGYELLISDIKGETLTIIFCDGVTFTYHAAYGKCCLTFTDERVGCGRDERRMYLQSSALRTLRVFVDACSIELFCNDGEEVMTTKYFPQDEIVLRMDGSAKVCGYRLRAVDICK